MREARITPLDGQYKVWLKGKSGVTATVRVKTFAEAETLSRLHLTSPRDDGVIRLMWDGSIRISGRVRVKRHRRKKKPVRAHLRKRTKRGR